MYSLRGFPRIFLGTTQRYPKTPGLSTLLTKKQIMFSTRVAVCELFSSQCLHARTLGDFQNTLPTDVPHKGVVLSLSSNVRPLDHRLFDSPNWRSTLQPHPTTASPWTCVCTCVGVYTCYLKLLSSMVCYCAHTPFLICPRLLPISLVVRRE